MPRVRSKRWCFTLNNPTEEEKEFITLCHLVLEKKKETENTRMKQLTYLISGIEQVSTLHIQGYLELTNKTSLSTMKKFIKRAHWEQARGTSLEASEYCKKDNNFKESGILAPGQGARNDLQEIKEAIDNGANELDIAENYFSRWVVYRRSFQAYATLTSSRRAWMTQVHVFWGKTGTGKTRFVYDQLMDSTFWSPGDYKWFDGYRGQDIVLLDDYRGEYPLQLLLKLCDRYPMQVPIKGGFVEWRPRKIYITSNIHPNDWYPNSDRFSVGAMFRRFTKVEAVFESLY